MVEVTERRKAAASVVSPTPTLVQSVISMIISRRDVAHPTILRMQRFLMVLVLNGLLNVISPSQLTPMMTKVHYALRWLVPMARTSRSLTLREMSEDFHAKVILTSSASRRMAKMPTICLPRALMKMVTMGYLMKAASAALRRHICTPMFTTRKPAATATPKRLRTLI